MAGTILHRILSKTKMAPLHLDTSPVEGNSPDMMNNTKQKIFFQEPTETRKLSLGDIGSRSVYSTRKHSYASIREDADVPQSFRVRQPSAASTSSAEEAPRRLELSKLRALASEVDDEVLSTDEESEFTHSYDGSVDSEVEDDVEEVGRSTTIEDLPEEILDQIFSKLQLHLSQASSLRPSADLFSCLFVSKTLHASALRVLYKHVVINRSRTFHKLVTSVQEDPELGRLIQTLDFAHYSHMGYGRSREQTNGTPYLTKENMKPVLNYARSLKAFLVHEHLDDELDTGVLSALFSIPTLQAVDFTSCSSETFVSSFSNVWTNALSSQYTQLKRLCLHECTTLKPKIFEAVLPRLGQITHLDLAHTRVNDTALLSIPSTARITHLNLERCTQITGDAVVHFLTEHPAAKHSMIWLNLSADASRYRLLSTENIDTLLPALPSTLRSLNLGGARITSQHAPALRLLATHLEELGLKGANLSLQSDITHILSLPPDHNVKLENPHLKSSLRYLDLTEISSVNQMSLSFSPISIKDNTSLPLEVIELGGEVLTAIARRIKNVKNPDWTVRELGRRGWYVRSHDSLPSNTQPDNGYRNWKMGARWWGMRKIPMVEQDVGGMYGYFMFKRN